MTNTTYTADECATWQELIVNRMKLLPSQACEMYLDGLQNLQLPISHIPSCAQINQTLQKFTNWQMVPTTELVAPHNYFRMLADCKFPAITSMRPRAEIDFYKSEKPDVVHEFLGHAPFLTNNDYANFMQQLSEIVLKYKKQNYILFGRLFWYTMEFGLVNSPTGLKAYGAGILPSSTETQQALDNTSNKTRKFDLLEIMRTPILATNKQKVYYVLPSFDTLFSLIDTDFNYYLKQAEKLKPLNY